MDYKKYKPMKKIINKDRTWPDNVITKAPMWCSVDLRDGNQALVNPMNLEEKVEFFSFLVKMGFKEIEVGFPAASDTEFNFLRKLIEDNLIPDDVTIQVLTQSRKHIIERTFESLEGIKKAVIHVYNSTSELQRRVVFDKSKEEIIQIAREGTELYVELAKKYGEDRFLFEYTPESFTGTELDFALEISNVVIDIIKPTADKKMILNLPNTVEFYTPNIYADQIEFMHKNIKNRNNVIISIHPHNDRGTAVACSELGVLAGADRVEGTLFGNGERTGNADILTIALNMYTQGIDPKLDFSKIDEVVEIYEKSTKMKVHERHPYAGDLVFTAFSGSHQDAIKKGMAYRKENNIFHWEIPYLPVDPMDFGKNYDPIIRINSQSGKGGVSFILEANYGIVVPKAMQPDFGQLVTNASDETQKELMPEDIYNIFSENYINLKTPIESIRYNETHTEEDMSEIFSKIKINGIEKEVSGIGNGILDAFSNAIKKEMNIDFEIKNYNEHSLDQGTNSRAITYVQIYDEDKVSYFGVGISTNISKSSIKAVTSAVNKLIMNKSN